MGELKLRWFPPLKVRQSKHHPRARWDHKSYVELTHMEGEMSEATKEAEMFRLVLEEP